MRQSYNRPLSLVCPPLSLVSLTLMSQCIPVDVIIYRFTQHRYILYTIAYQCTYTRIVHARTTSPCTRVLHRQTHWRQCNKQWADVDNWG